MKRTDQAAHLGAVGRAGNALLSIPRRRAARAAVSIALKPRSPIRTGAYKSRRTVTVCRCPLAESPAPPSVVSDTVRARPVVAAQPSYSAPATYSMPPGALAGCPGVERGSSRKPFEVT